MFVVLAGCARQDSAAVDISRWQPANDDAVVFAIPANPAGNSSLYQKRAALRADNNDPELAADYARTALRNYARSGDPRLLGYADGALQPWRETLSPPLDIWLLRVRLLQTQHQFESAARDVDALLEAQPGHPEALLLSADAWRRSGDLATAKNRCLTLSLSGSLALAQLCAADILLSLGHPQRAMATAAATLADNRHTLQDDTIAWAYAMHAEAATASGNISVALDSWSRALNATRKPALATRLGHVDTLLEAQRFSEALLHLENLPEADAVLLRRAIAGATLQHSQFASWQGELARRFNDPMYADDDSLHWRELALYELHVNGDAKAALKFAQRNWQIQKGFEDAELLLRAARAAGDATAARPVTEWRRLHGATS